jgi:hypothetical protein
MILYLVVGGIQLGGLLLDPHKTFHERVLTPIAHKRGMAQILFFDKDRPNSCPHGSSCGYSSKMCHPFVGQHILDFVELPSMPCKGTRAQAVVRQFYLCPLNTEHRHTHKILIHYLPRLICKRILLEKLLYN